MSAQSATAHTRRARGRSSGRPPAVKTSASGAKDGRPQLGRWGTGRTKAPGLSARLPDIRVRKPPSTISEFLIAPESLEERAFIKVCNPHTEYLFIYVLNYL